MCKKEVNPERKNFTFSIDKRGKSGYNILNPLNGKKPKNATAESLCRVAVSKDRRISDCAPVRIASETKVWGGVFPR